MEATTTQHNAAERRKQVRLRLRPDLNITPQKYEGRTCHVVKDPVSLRYYRFNDQEYFVIQQLNGKSTLEDTQKAFEREFRPHRLTLEDLEAFARQLISAGLVHHESAHAAKHLFDRRTKQKWMRRLGTFTNILYIKVPLFDPDRLLARMLPYTWWIFTTWFLVLSIGLMLSAVMLVTTHFQTFYDKLPAYQEFFRFNTLLYLWISLGIVKVIHEFGHGLSCKAFGGECHEMGALFLCLSPALYCNVSDSWTLPDKWKRIIISFAGIYVELVIAAIATWVWWYTPSQPFVNNIALCLMILCSVSTVVFNANPLMRFDGYYMLADWLEIPNLSQRANKYLQNLASEYCLGIEVQPEAYMSMRRKVLFVTYAVVSYFYRWFITFSILFFLSGFLKPYKLGSLSMLLALVAAGSMIGWPLYRLIRSVQQRGRLPDMKMVRVVISLAVVAGLIGVFLFVPMPISRIRNTGVVQVQPDHVRKVFIQTPGVLQEVYVKDGQRVQAGDLIARFRNLDLEAKRAEAAAQANIQERQIEVLRQQFTEVGGVDAAKSRLELQQQLTEATGEANMYAGQRAVLDEQIRTLGEVRAPCDGIVMSPPRREDIGKLWDMEQNLPICSIGKQEHLQLLVPVVPADYRLLQDDLATEGTLPATIHIPGASQLTWSGVVRRLPESDAKEVPEQLTQKSGGPLAIKPGEKPDSTVPAAQHYLIQTEIVDSDNTILPGTLAQVKIHCRWRTCGWWTWRAISSALDLGLIG